MKTARCRCGRLVVNDPARQVISHEAPECDWFRQLLQQGPKPDATFVEVLDVDDPSKVQ